MKTENERVNEVLTQALEIAADTHALKRPAPNTKQYLPYMVEARQRAQGDLLLAEIRSVNKSLDVIAVAINANTKAIADVANVIDGAT